MYFNNINQNVFQKHIAIIFIVKWNRTDVHDVFYKPCFLNTIIPDENKYGFKCIV